jgi:hypothetical protein
VCIERCSHGCAGRLKNSKMFPEVKVWSPHPVEQKPPFRQQEKNSGEIFLVIVLCFQSIILSNLDCCCFLFRLTFFMTWGKACGASRWGDVTAVDKLEGVAVADAGRW